MSLIPQPRDSFQYMPSDLPGFMINPFRAQLSTRNLKKISCRYQWQLGKHRDEDDDDDDTKLIRRERDHLLQYAQS